MAKINFFNEDISFTLKQKTKIKSWIKSAITEEGFELNELNFIFCSDAYLLKINRDFLDHDDYTDVITFDHSETHHLIAGDIFISMERIKENADSFHVSITDELCRVMIHGTLHLLGYKDKTKAAKLRMTAKENYYLDTRSLYL